MAAGNDSGILFSLALGYDDIGARKRDVAGRVCGTEGNRVDAAPTATATLGSHEDLSAGRHMDVVHRIAVALSVIRLAHGDARQLHERIRIEIVGHRDGWCDRN